MKCPECEKEELKSRAYIGTISATQMDVRPYYDEDGNLHVPNDPNTITTEYTCSNGHSFKETK
jgi:hypothetical protein